MLVLAASDGVRVGTERAYHYAREHGLGIAAVANKMDHERADYDACAKQLEESLGVRVVKLHLPLGRGETFRGFVNLLTGKAHHLDATEDRPGRPPPARHRDRAAASR